MNHITRQMILRELLRGQSPFRLGTVPFLLLLLLLPLWPPGNADAQFAGTLRGDYNETLYRSCTAAPAGYSFGSNFELTSQGVIATANVQDFVVRGTVHYNGDGTGSQSGQVLATFGTNLPTTAGQTVVPLNQNDFTCTFTYTVNADGTFSRTANCNNTFIAGNLSGSTSTLNPITVNGQISLDGTVLVFNDTTPNVETFTWTSGPASGISFERVCNGTGTATARR